VKPVVAAQSEQRVLVLAPTGRDAQLVQSLLEQDGVTCTPCAHIEALCSELESGAAALLLAEESMFDPDIERLARALGDQPTWSDLPVLLLTRHGADSPEVARALAILGNVTLLERPTRVAALVSTVRSALRARSRQYLLRAELAARESAERLRRAELAVTQVLAIAGSAHDALEGILRVVCESLGWALGAVWEVSGEVVVCTEVSPSAASGYPDFVRACGTMRFARGVGLPGRVWADGKPAWIPDVARDANFPRARIAIAAGLHSGFGLPIRHEEQIVGVMEFLSPEIREPDPDLLGMMNTIGAYIGQVLENKRAEEKLRRSEATLTEFFENATVGLHWVGPDGKILRANRAELEMLGYPAEEYVGRNIADFHVDRDVIDDILARLLRCEDVDDYQARMRCKDGTVKTVLISSSVLLEDGKFVHSRCFTRDITARTQAEAELVELRNRLATDLAGMTRLQSISRRLVQTGDVKSVLVDVVDAAMAILSADMGLVQLRDRRTGAVELFGARGFADHELDMHTSLVPALGSERRMIFGDVETDPLLTDSPARAAILASGARALQSTLLVTRSGEVLGVLSTHWRRAHTPDERELRLFDLLAREAADFVERIHAEEALRERTDLLELANEAIVVRASDGTVRYWSQGAQETYGWSAEEMIGRPMHEKLQTRFPTRMSRVEGALVRDGHWEGELIQVHKNGHELVIDSRWALRRGEQGTQVSVLEINRDVTDKKRADVALHETQARVRERAEELETLMDAVPAIVFVAHDVECRRLTGNRAAYEFMQMRPGSNLSNTAPEGERPTHFRVFRGGVEQAAEHLPLQVAARGSAVRGEELEIVFADGQRRHMYGSAIPLTGENGEPRGAIGSFLDITGRKRIEEALRQSERVYRGIGESIEYGVWVCDAEGRNVYASDSFLEMTGLSQEECAGFAWTRLLHEDDREDTIASWKECVRSSIPWYREHRVLGVDGKYHPILARGVPVYDEEGALVCWAGTNLDIARLKEAQDSLREADRRKDEFLATLAHELRNPLAPIRTSIQVLRGLDLREPDFAWSRNVIDRQTQHLTRLVDDLLDVSRITRGKVELRRERLLLADVVRSVLEATRALVQAAGHELRVVQPDQPIPLNADPVRIAQCLSNLLNNAVKYTPPGGHIDLSIEREGDTVAIKVRDDGIGIPESELARVFEMFSQVDTALERAQGGLGIGLSIVKSFVELHGGTVEVKSDGPGRGSAFTMRLPVDTRGLELRPARRGGNGVPNGAAHRILVVDDNRDSAESLSIFLRRSGHEVQTVYDGEKAIAALAAFHPEVVVLDIGLPGLSGFEVARRMRKEPGGNRLLLIAATGWGQAEHLSRSREAGFDHHMVKPIDVLALQQLLAQP
jgi:PAS domain S-box-containing protein